MNLQDIHIPQPKELCFDGYRPNVWRKEAMNVYIHYDFN